MPSILAVDAGMTAQRARGGADGEALSGQPWVAEPGQGLVHSSSPLTGVLLQELSLTQAG